MSDPIIVSAIAFLAACAIFLAGMWVGVGAERKAWLLRAVTKEKPHSTPHHCDGEFYYIVAEGVFVNEYKRRHTCPAKPEAKS